MSVMSNEDYQRTLNQLSVLAASLRMMPIEDFLETIAEAESEQAISKPTESQKRDVDDIKHVAEKALELKQLAIEIAGQAAKVRIHLPGPGGTIN